MYTTINFKTKKALKEAVKAWLDYQEFKSSRMTIGAIIDSKVKPAKPVTYYQPGPFGGNEPVNGKIYVEGPHYPEAHKWYATCEVKDGYIISVK